MKSFENSFEAPKVYLPCSILLENHFFPTGNKKIFFEKRLRTFFFRKNFAQCRKKIKGGPFGLFRFCRLRKKGKK